MARPLSTAVLCALVLLCSLAAHAQYDIPHSVIGSGGGTQAGPSNSITGTVGQPQIGVVSGSSYVGEIGFWYMPGWVLTAVEEFALPTAYGLGQNYPNPFNPVTTFLFAVPTHSRVTVKLYNVAGREVRTLVDEELDPGYHRTVLEGSGLSSGVYFCRMSSGSFEEVRKITLLK
jgi:hypothetical protein